jgi:hypothetical protein
MLMAIMEQPAQAIEHVLVLQHVLTAQLNKVDRTADALMKASETRASSIS